MDNIKLAIDVALSVIKALKEETFSTIFNNEIESAEIIGRTINQESDIRDGLNRILTHLETAYISYTKSIGEFNLSAIIDYDGVVYKKASKLNKICEGIALVHYKLGNIEVAQQWLYKMSKYGKYFHSKSFYETILKDKYSDFDKRILQISDDFKNSIDTYKRIIVERESGWGPHML